MDVGTLRLALAKIRGKESSEQLRDAVDALEDRLENAQQWLYTTDPQALAGLRTSLGQVHHTIYVTLERIQGGLDNGDKTRNVRASWNILLQRRQTDTHSSDLHECVLLMDFVLSTLLLPLGPESAKTASDLAFAARILHDAHQRSGSERRAIFDSQRSTILRSDGFETFIAKVSGVESQGDGHARMQVPQTAAGASSSYEAYSPSAPPPWQNADPFVDTLPTRNGKADELRAWSAQMRTRPRQASQPLTICEMAFMENAPPLPPKEAANSSDAMAHKVAQHRIARRPVARASSTPVETAPPLTPPLTPQNSRAHRSSTLRRSRRGRRTGTHELFERASNSLGNLTIESDDDDSADEQDLPPPYVERATGHAAPADVKRPHAHSVSSMVSMNNSTFALVQDNLHEQLRERVEQGGSINDVDPLTKRTVLMEAAQLERVTMIGVILPVSSQVHQKDLEGNSALHFAASRGNHSICKALLETGANVEDYNKNGETPITLAARGGHTDAVDCLLNFWTVQRGSAAVLTKGYLEALKSGNVSTVAAFIERHIKPKKVKESVLCAAEGGSVPVLDYILAQKAALKERNPDAWTALHFAAEKGHVAMVEKLLALGLSWKAQTKKVGETALAIAIRNSQVATARSLILHKDSQVNRHDNDRITPLQHAVRLGDLGLVTTLLNAGAKLDVQSKYGWTAMHTAVAYGHAHLVAELITRGISIEEKLGDVELNPLEKTNEGARRGYWAEIRWPHSGARPLHLSLEFGHDEVANLLLAAGAKMDVPDGKGWRPLHHASFSARSALAELLLSKGASPHATTDDNTTPLGLGFRAYGLSASEEDKIKVWELLQGAMNAMKKSKRKQFADFMSASSAGRQVEKRNRVWHTAELAASLHLHDDADDESSEQRSKLTNSTDDAAQEESNAQETGRIVSRTSFAQDVKS